MSEETIFREVDEELRRDRLRTAWRRFGPWLIVAAVVVVLGVAANEGWNWWQSSNSAKSSDQFYAALELEQAGDVDGAQKALDMLIAQGTGQYPALAKFKQAGLLAKRGKTADALATYDALSTSQTDQRLKEAALLLGAQLLVDKGDVPGVKQRVQGLMLDGSNPLRNSAREAVGLAQYKSNDLAGAAASFQSVLADPLSTDQARGRMQLYLAQLAAQGFVAPTPVAAAVPTGDAKAAATAALDALAGPGTDTPPSGVAKLTEVTGSAANDNAATGVESNQPVTPDSSLQLAVPAAPAETTTPSLSPGADVLTGGAAPAATAPVATPTPSATSATPAPAATAAPEGAAKPAPTANPAPAASTPAASATTPAPATTTPASGTTGQ
jgi:hypothetical protein